MFVYFLSVIGTSIRLALTEIPVPYSIILSQILGNFIYGIAINKNLQSDIKVGLCGSLTTWSSFILDIFLSLKRGLIGDALFYLLLTMASSYGVFKFGSSFWPVSQEVDGEQELLEMNYPQTLETVDQNVQNRICKSNCLFSWNDFCFYISYGILLVAGLTILIFWLKWDSFTLTIWISLLLSPFGTFCRIQLCKYNRNDTNFFLNSVRGTFLANTIGCISLTVFYVINSHFGKNSGVVGVLCNGLIKGFCGCLTTLSSLMNELVLFPKINSIRYFLSLFFICETLMLFTLL
jgi:fluoride ion exporter CrcB/FEX